jgi:hypothetical protein
MKRKKNLENETRWGLPANPVLLSIQTSKLLQSALASATAFLSATYAHFAATHIHRIWCTLIRWSRLLPQLHLTGEHPARNTINHNPALTQLNRAAISAASVSFYFAYIGAPFTGYAEQPASGHMTLKPEIGVEAFAVAGRGNRAGLASESGEGRPTRRRGACFAGRFATAGSDRAQQTKRRRALAIRRRNHRENGGRTIGPGHFNLLKVCVTLRKVVLPATFKSNARFSCSSYEEKKNPGVARVKELRSFSSKSRKESDTYD